MKTTIAILILGCSTLAFTNETALPQPNKIVPHSPNPIIYHKGDPPTKDKYTREQVRSAIIESKQKASILDVVLPPNDIDALTDLLCGMNEQGGELMNPAYHQFFINRDRTLEYKKDGINLKAIKFPEDPSRYSIEISWNFEDIMDEYKIPRTQFKCTKQYGKTWTSNWTIETDPKLE